MQNLRKHKRFTIAAETRARAHDKIARVMDISRGGLSLLFLDSSNNSLAGEISLDLLCNEKGLDARQIPGKIVWNKEISYSNIPGMLYKKVGIQFGTLSETQKDLLQALLSSSHDKSMAANA